MVAAADVEERVLVLVERLLPTGYRYYFSQCPEMQLVAGWAVACVWLTVLLRNGQRQSISKWRFGDSVFICKEILVSSSLVNSCCILKIFIGVEVSLG